MKLTIELGVSSDDRKTVNLSGWCDDVVMDQRGIEREIESIQQSVFNDVDLWLVCK